MQQNTGTRVSSEGIRFSTKGKKTELRDFDIKFKPVGFSTMTIYQDILRIIIIKN